MIDTIFKFIFSKKVFTKPKQFDLVVIDEAQKEIFSDYLKNYNHSFLDIRLNKINLYVLFKTIIKFKFKTNFYRYICEYLKFTNCKIILTFNDNLLWFYELKKDLKNIIAISIQNGHRRDFFFNDLNQKNELMCDYIFTWEKKFRKSFQIVRSETIELGSFKNNLSQIKKNNNKTISYISDLNNNFDKYRYIDGKKFTFDEWYSIEKKILPIISTFCKNLNYDFKIIGRCRGSFAKKEKFFYDTVLHNHKFKFIESNDEYNCYNIIDDSFLVVGIYSSLILEAIGRKARVAILNLRKELISENYNIFWPKKFSSEGFFWTDKLEVSNINKVLKNVYDANPDILEKEYEHLRDIIIFDEKNKKFKELLENKFSN